MSDVRRNIYANYLGGAWSALMGIAFIPLYIKYMGMESYGLIAVFALMQSWLTLLDLGLTPTLSRELARYRAGALPAALIRDLVHSVERVYFAIAVGVAVVLVASAGWSATHWVKVETLPSSSVTRAFAIAGIVIAIRWVVGLYRNALLGLEKQVWLNGCTAAFATLRSAGVIVVLIWISPSVSAFFVFQGACFFAEGLTLAVAVRHSLPTIAQPPRFSLAALHQIWRFAAGMTVITLLSILLTQIDKLALSRLLPLKEFGYYALASTVAGSLGLIIGPVNNAIYPRLTALVAGNDTGPLADMYHKASQALTLMLLPATAVLCFFSHNILLLWTHDSILTDAVAPLMSILVIGTMLNGLMHTPYSLQLAYGWTRFMVIVNTLSVLIVLPALYFSVRRYGGVAAAIIWDILNASYILIAVPLMHRRLLPNDLWKWLWQDVGVPGGAAIGIAAVIYTAAPAVSEDSRAGNLALITVAGLTSFAASALATPLGRAGVTDLRKRFFA